MRFIGDNQEQVGGTFVFMLDAPTASFTTVITPAEGEFAEQTGVRVELSPEEVIEKFAAVVDRAKELLANESDEERQARYARYAAAEASADGEPAAPEAKPADDTTVEPEKPADANPVAPDVVIDGAGTVEPAPAGGGEGDAASS